MYFYRENSAQHAGEMKKSQRRSTSIIGMAPDIDPSTWDHREEEKYGLGKGKYECDCKLLELRHSLVRPLSQFYKIFLINVEDRKAVPLCPFVQSGIMHNDFQPFLHTDGLGIDYTKLLEYDTQSVLDKHTERLHPYWQRQIEEGLESGDRAKLMKAVSVAEEIGLAKKSPDLLAKATSFLRN